MPTRRPSVDGATRNRTAETGTRRQFLGRVGAFGSATGLATLAGCLSGTAAEPAGYTDWLAAPDLFGGRRYFFDYYDVAAIREHREAFDPAAYEAYRAWAADGYDHFGLPFEAVDEELLGVNRRLTVLRGDWNVDAVDEYLKATGYVEADPHAGFDFYRHRVAKLAIAVNADRLLRSRRTDRSPLGTVRLFVNVGVGQERRYAESDPVIAELTARLGEGTYVYGFPHVRSDSTDVERGEFRAAEARGFTRTVDGSRTTDRVVLAFRDDSDVTDAMADIEAWVETAPVFDGAEAIELEPEGRSAVVTLQRRTADLDELTPRL